jgi:hypothetical protein
MQATPSGNFVVAATGPDAGATVQRLYVAQGAELLRLTPSETTDNGAPITGRYRSGFWTPTAGNPRVDGKYWLHDWYFDGTGVVTQRAAVSDNVALGNAATVTMGTAPAVARGYARNSAHGTNFSLELSGTAPWSVSKAGARVH